VCRQLKMPRPIRGLVPVIMLSPASEEVDRGARPGNGADDYVISPIPLSS